MISYYQSIRYSVRMKDKLCNVCDYVTNKTSHLKRHMMVHDKPVEPLNCSICQKSFEIKKYLTAHIKTHIPKDNSSTEELKEKKKCTTCSFETNSNSKLERHMKTHEKNSNNKVKSGKKIKFVTFALL